MSYKLKLGLILLVLGLLGVLSLATVEFGPGMIPAEVLDTVPAETLKWPLLINPAILLIISVIIGTLLHEKVGLTVPLISSLLLGKPAAAIAREQLIYGISLGLISGIIIMALSALFKSIIPLEFEQLGEGINLTLVARFGYGGITEELLLRYGLMTLVVWLVFLVSKKLNNTTYYMGILVATVLFAIGHFPAAMAAVEDPSSVLLTYIFIGNSAAGIIFGWLYWKKGLEAAIIAHIFAHVAMVSIQAFTG
jgi:hypothetical protein